MKLRPWLLPVLTVVLANTYALSVVLRDRAGTPLATVTLSDRELDRWGVDDENSGVLLNWSWHSMTLDSITRERAAALGFNCRSTTGPCGGAVEDLRGYALVGLDLEGWARDTLVITTRIDSIRRSSLPDSVKEQRVEYAESDLRRARGASRLAVFDVARSVDELRERQGAGQFIVSATLDLSYDLRANARDSSHFDLYARPEPGKLYLPTRIAAGFRGRRMNDDRFEGRYLNDPGAERSERYEVTVAIGAAGLPRVTEVTWSVDSTRRTPAHGDTTESLLPPEE